MAGGDEAVDRGDHKGLQAAYHDWEAASYDAKFGISWDDHVTAYAAERFRKGLGGEPRHGRILELGAGTGFFAVNLVRAGLLVGEVVCSDISPGMLDVCARNATANDVAITTRVADAEDLPFEDQAFDVVVGHAVLHHLPVPGLAVREAFRVLRPGGVLLIAGEPTHWGERATTVVKRLAWRGVRAVTAMPRLGHLRRPAPDHDDTDADLAALEHEVDLHTFHPDEVERMATVAGFTDVRVVTEELAANWWGWGIRTIEGSLSDDATGARWAMTAFRGYRALTWFDETVLQPLVPRGLFYNLVLSASRPDA